MCDTDWQLWSFDESLTADTPPRPLTADTPPRPLTADTPPLSLTADTPPLSLTADTRPGPSLLTHASAPHC